MTSRHLFSAIFIVSAVSIFDCGPALADRMPFVLAADPPVQSIQVGQKATIRISQKNVGPVDAVVPQNNMVQTGHGEFDYVIGIVDEHGHVPPETPDGSRNLHPVAGSGQRITIKAGDTRVETIPISDLFTLSAGHTYTILARWIRRPSIYIGPLNSNPVKVVVK